MVEGSTKSQKVTTLSKEGQASMADLMRILRKLRPNPPTDLSFLASLFLDGAVSKTTAKRLVDLPFVEELESRKMVKKTGTQLFYLTQDGILLAKGALRVYPELQIPPVA